MKSADAGLLGRQTPRVKVAPAAADSDGGDVAELCAAYGLVLDEWQRIALDAGLGIDERGLHSADTVAIVASRQSGKGALIEARVLAGVLLLGEKTLACSAHESRTTRLSFDRVLSYFENYDDLRKRLLRVQRWVGREQIQFRSGQTIVFPARSRGALRGYSLDALILDEAQYLTAAQYEAVLPTLSARPNTQTWHLGTVPSHVGDGEVLGRIRAAALSGNPGRLAYLEWSAEPGSDLDSPTVWAEANPAMGTRISLESIAQERRELTPAGFSRERLSIWSTDATETVFNLDWWKSLAGSGPANGTPPTALAVDAGHDQAVVIAAAWKLENRTHVELLSIDGGDPMVAQQMVIDLAKRRTPVVIDAASPAASLVLGLQLEKVKVLLTTARDMAGACANFVADVEGGRISHAGQQPLDDAVAGARKRPILDAGQFAFNRRDSTVHIAPLVAATLARHGAQTTRARSGRATFA